MTRDLRELCRKAEGLRAEARAIAENERASSADLTRGEAIVKELRALQAEIDEKQRQEGADLSARQGRPISGGVAAKAWGSEVRVFQRGEKLAEAYPNSEGLSLGRYVRGMVTGDWRGAEREREEYRALSTSTGTVLIPKELSAEVLDLARNKSVLLNAGVPLVEMTSNNLTLAKIDEDPDFGFKAELQPVDATDFSFGKAELKARTAYGLLKVSLEVLHSAQNLEAVLKNAMAGAMARIIDQACLFGAGGVEPTGVLLLDTINKITATAPFKAYEPYIRALSKIRQNNGEPTFWCINAREDERLNLSQDGEGKPVEIPACLANLTRLVSNQLPANTGAGQNESISAMFDPAALAIGQQVPLTVKVSDTAGDALSTGAVYLAIYSMLDVCAINPKHICRIDGLPTIED